MWNFVKKIYKASAPVRFIYHSVAIISIFFTLASLLFSGFFDHRLWVNERLAASYAVVEEEQISVLQMLLAVVPSRANGDRTPSKEEIAELRRALAQLSGRVASVDAVSEDIALASSAYRGSIAELSGALVRYTPDDPASHGDLLLAVDRWDVAAKSYSEIIEKRINRYSRTLLPSA